MTAMEYRCKYCGAKVSQIEFEVGNGFCDRCRNVIEWKKTLADLKEFEK